MDAKAESKAEDTQLEHASAEKGSFKADVDHSAVEHVYVSEEDSRRICRKIDMRLLTVLMWVYFLQILLRSPLDADRCLLLGSQPHGMGASNGYAGLMACRFLLGWFEAMVLPMFSLITVQYYRRLEQPLRVALWYAGNGWASLFGSLIVYGCGHIKSSVLHSYQIIFLLNGLITVVTGMALYWRIDHGVHTARFLSPEDRLKAVERLRANKTGVDDEQSKFKWGQALEIFLEPKTYLFIAMTICVNVGASVVTVFSPLILQSVAGFSPYTTSLLNIPFGVLQVVVILSASYAATHWRLKAPVLMAFTVPVIVGTALLYTLPRTPQYKGPLMLGFYLLAFLFAANPVLLAWIAANTAGKSKKTSIYSAYNGASAIGNIIAPHVFKAADAPLYLPGLKATLAFFCILQALIAGQVFILYLLNKKKERQRVANGKPAKIHDLSMDRKFDNSELTTDKRLGEQDDLDITDRRPSSLLSAASLSLLPLQHRIMSAPLPNADTLSSINSQPSGAGQQPSGSALANDFQQTYGEGQQGPTGEQGTRHNPVTKSSEAGDEHLISSKQTDGTFPEQVGAQTKTPSFIEQVVGQAKVFRGKTFGKDDQVAVGEALLQGQGKEGALAAGEAAKH
ncbi:major facilitator superfamily domain-containing protein [Leucosporidium creatinivorum]|uniref:Major facilitator superfamily domain-containing protein n=1 Tax=Leucosporidium creatinivorum TaxID=106004 RepID=A0A1Y2FVW5_9BASI|nr:major facilitator superfamily domain-containing protein [Leucosporidium creatinivorum]